MKIKPKGIINHASITIVITVQNTPKRATAIPIIPLMNDGPLPGFMLFII